MVRNIFLKRKELNCSHKIKFSNLRSTTSVRKDIGVKTSEFVAKTQFLCQ